MEEKWLPEESTLGSAFTSTQHRTLIFRLEKFIVNHDIRVNYEDFPVTNYPDNEDDGPSVVTFTPWTDQKTEHSTNVQCST